MAQNQHDDDRQIDQALESLAAQEGHGTPDDPEREALFAQLAQRIEEPGIQDRILERYQSMGAELLSDSLPGRVDPKIARALRPYLGDVDDVRVHTGKVASEAAAAMDARAFAVGSRDIFIDQREFNPQSKEGATLLAHEIAHTRDASTGFALSARHGASTSAREAFAHDIERLFAREWDAEEESGSSSEIQAEPHDTAEHGGEPEVDKTLLAEKVWDVIKRQIRNSRERTGRW